ncbi:hypothetical protein GCM10009839_78220 [Catenulispora yoronensis]|uniref:Sulphur transport domain-containing protein n=1 Tax=Catenulispora yoronensis TaxID=450799 RepID=A0ABN2VD91_9ACTN
MGNAFAPSSRISRAIQLLTFGAVAVALGAVSWRCTPLNLPDVGQFAGIAGSAFLGGVLNPIKDVAAARGAAEGLQTKFDALWLAAVAIGGGAIVSGALALGIDGQRHVNAAAALTALTTAFGGLFLDTSKLTHLPDPSTTASGATAAAAAAANAGGGGGGGGAGVFVVGGSGGSGAASGSETAGPTKDTSGNKDTGESNAAGDSKDSGGS